jgi:glutathione S-transferase
MSPHSDLKSIKLYGASGANPPKVAMLLEEMRLPYSIIEIPYAEIKKPDYIDINPNGRLPAIHDPNTDLTLWESGAILEYIIETYDKERQLSYDLGSKESWLCKQWLHFQMSGQGPYYGQAAWFRKFHHEQLPSAIDRYVAEVKRVTGVLESHLSKQRTAHSDSIGDGPWLVGNKMTYADMSFLAWQIIVSFFPVPDLYEAGSFPEVFGWLERMKTREGIKKVLDEQVYIRLKEA